MADVTRGLRPYVRRVRAYYDAASAAYQENLGTTLQVAVVETGATDVVSGSNRFLAAAAEICAGHRVLDAGCGVGGPAIDIAGAMAGVTINAVTVSPVQAAAATALASEAGVRDRVDVTVADFHDLPFADATFDRVIFFESSGYTDQPRRLFREVHRVLCPGGILYIKDVFRRSGRLSPEQERELAEFEKVYLHRTPVAVDVLKHIADVGLEVTRFLNLREYEVTSGGAIRIDTGARFLQALVRTTDDGPAVTTLGRGHLRPWQHLPVFFGEIKAHRPYD